MANIADGISESAAQTAPVLERIDPYIEWRKREEVLLGGGVYIKDMREVEVSPWPRKGVNGALYYLDGDDEEDEHIVEIPPGGCTIPERHMYDEAVYVLKGRGTASLWWEEHRKQTFEWGEGSFFALPLNVRYQLFNVSGSEPARYFSITNLPSIMRQFHNEDFIFNCAFAFRDRYGGEDDYFSGEGQLRGRQWEANFVPDLRKIKLLEYKERGGGGTNIGFSLARGTVGAHISRFQPCTYKKGHKHGPHAHLYIPQGEGYSLVKRGDEPWIKVDWGEGSMFLSGAGPGWWLHQHFNVGATPASYLATHVGQPAYFAPSRWPADDPTWKTGGAAGSITAPPRATWRTIHFPGGNVDEKEGGRQVEYEDEDPYVHELFEEELAKRGVTCRMKNLHPRCTGVEGPTQKGEWGDEK